VSNSSSKIRAIIFDIGRVIIKLDIQKAQLGLAKGLKLSPEEIWSAIINDPRFPDWQDGRMSARDWHLHLCQRFSIALDFDQFTQVWNSTLDPTPLLPDSFFADLSKSYKLALLSNTDPIHVAYLEANYSFYQYFPKPMRIYSCSVGASKPDPLIFREALKACKVNANEAIYIDDIADYAQAAGSLGCTGLQFRSAEALYRDLSALGISLREYRTT
jgi:glucose-1-phosphatase